MKNLLGNKNIGTSFEVFEVFVVGLFGVVEDFFYEDDDSIENGLVSDVFKHGVQNLVEDLFFEIFILVLSVFIL